MSCISCDALVVGGGPAGLAAAIALRQRGLAVIVADALVPPIDKACGEGLMPDGREELAALGVEVRAGLGWEFSGVQFASRSGKRERLATAKFSGGRGVGLARVELHRLLTERALEAGAQLRWGARVELGDGEVRVGRETCRYRYLVGADGEASRVRQWAGLDAGRVSSRRFGFRRHYRVAPWSDEAGASLVEVHWGPLGQAYVTPVAADEVCVAGVTRHRGVGMDDILAGLPYLRAKLDGHEATGRQRGAVTVTRRLRRVTRGNVALIGDASGSADAITGEGLATAFRHARLLGRALGNDAIADYEAGHGEILRLPQRMAGVLTMLDRSTFLRERALAVLAANPALFGGLLAVHVGEISPADFVARHGFAAGWEFLLSVGFGSVNL